VVGAWVGAGAVALVSDGVGMGAGQEGVLGGLVRVGLAGELGGVGLALCCVAGGIFLGATVLVGVVPGTGSADAFGEEGSTS
jgi:hypothetical protein